MPELLHQPLAPGLGACDLGELRRRTSEKWARHGHDVLPAFVAEMDFDVAEPIRRAVVDSVGRSDLGYPHEGALGAAFSPYAKEMWDWAVAEEHVHACPDVMTGVATVLTACTPPGSGVVVNPPVYPPFLFRTEQTDRSVVPVPLVGDDFEIDLAGLDEALARPEVCSYLLCSPHNPLGRVWSREQLLEVADICQQHGTFLIVDEIHAPLVMSGAEFVPFLSLDHPMAERAVVFHSASKGWNVPGLKCGLVVTSSPDVNEALGARWEALFPSQLGLVATVAAFTADGCRRWLWSALRQLEENRRILPELLSAELPGIVWERPQASYLVWLGCEALGLGDDPAAVFLERGRVALNRGLDFGEPGRGHVRLNMGTSPAILEEIVVRMAAALRAQEIGTSQPMRSAISLHVGQSG